MSDCVQTLNDALVMLTTWVAFPNLKARGKNILRRSYSRSYSFYLGSRWWLSSCFHRRASSQRRGATIDDLASAVVLGDVLLLFSVSGHLGRHFFFCAGKGLGEGEGEGEG